MKKILTKLKIIYYVTISESIIVVSRRGEKVMAASRGHHSDPIFDHALDMAGGMMVARCLEDGATEAVEKLKKECGLA